MVGQIIPPLGLLIGTGCPLNMLVTNKWYSYKTLPSIKSVPILMLVSGQVCDAGGIRLGFRDEEVIKLPIYIASTCFTVI